jgi:hypothetical protein
MRDGGQPSRDTERELAGLPTEARFREVAFDSLRSLRTFASAEIRSRPAMSEAPEGTLLGL